MLADEYILSFISLSAYIQLTEFYQLLLLSSSSVFQSAAAPGWTLKIPAQQQALDVVCNSKTSPKKEKTNFMRKIAIGFAVVVMGLTIFFTWKALCSPNNQSLLGIGSFIILSLTLVVLIWYAYDTNSIARITRDRWVREGVLSTTYNIQLIGEKGDAGRTLFQLTNPSTLVVKARVNCNFKVYGQPVSAGRAYDGTDTWLLFPQQMSQGWFEIATLLSLKGKSIATMIGESTDANSEEQLSMILELEFWDELGVNRKLPKRQHYFDFRRWSWIPHLTQR